MNGFTGPLKAAGLESLYGNAIFMDSSDNNDKGVRGPVQGWHLFWEGGYITIESPEAKSYFLINGQARERGK